MEKSPASSYRILTVGHSNHTFAHFLELLDLHSVQVVVDVRSAPYSKYAKQFDYELLKTALQDSPVRYLYLGRELGGRPKQNEFYDEQGNVLYDRVAASPLFEEGMARLERGIRQYKVAVLCAEENPAACHRRLLVGRVLLKRRIRVEHIRGDGRIQTEQELDAELNPDRDQLSLFSGMKG